jgi:hypothetical protein
MPYTQNQLEEAFKKVQNKEHWKNPINSCCKNEDLLVTIAAIRHFTATEVTYFNLGNGWFKVEAPGYRLGPAN